MGRELFTSGDSFLELAGGATAMGTVGFRGHGVLGTMESTVLTVDLAFVSRCFDKKGLQQAMRIEQMSKDAFFAFCI